MNRFLVVTNPNAAGGKSASQARKFLSALTDSGINYEEISESDLSDCLASVEEKLSSKQFSSIIAIGGDGLVHHLLEPVTRHQVPIHIVPAGSGNDCARALGMHTLSVTQRIALLKEMNTRMIDLGELVTANSTKLFLQIASSGFDAQVNRHANQHPRYPASLKYLISTLLLIWRAKPIEYEFHVEGSAPKKVRAMLFLGANGANYGGGMKIAPTASHTDGMLDFMYVTPAKPLELLCVFPLVYVGLHVKHPKIHFIRARSMQLSINASSDPEAMIFADGERTLNMPALVRISDRKLTILGT